MGNRETGNRRWETVDGRKKTGDGKRETEHRKTGSLTSYQKKFSAFNLVDEFVNFKERLLIIENINLQ